MKAIWPSDTTSGVFMLQPVYTHHDSNLHWPTSRLTKCWTDITVQITFETYNTQLSVWQSTKCRKWRVQPLTNKENKNLSKSTNNDPNRVY